MAKSCKENPKEFFALVNSRKPIKNNIGPIKDRNNILQYKDIEIANTLNEYFASVFAKEDLSCNPTSKSVYLRDKPLETLNDVYNAINKMNKNKSPGPDKMISKVLKEAKEEIVEQLLYIFNLSLEKGIVPQDWKLANVTPIFKKGCKESASNYRPISLTSVVGKMLESIIAEKIVTHLE